jgi:uncharacterized protein
VRSTRAAEAVAGLGRWADIAQQHFMKNTRNPVGWFEIYVQNMKRAQSFYEKTFQVKLAPLPSPGMEMLAFPGGPEGYGCPGALVKMEGKDSGGGGTVVYFSCEDCAVESERAAKDGGEIFKEKFSIGEYGFIALVVDTEGNMIGLHSMR